MIKALLMVLSILFGSISIVILLGTVVNVRKEKFKREDAIVGGVLFVVLVFLCVFCAWACFA